MIKRKVSFFIFLISILLGVFSGLSDVAWLTEISKGITIVFVNLFKSLSLPLVATSITITLAGYKTSKVMKKIWQNTILYTITTTVVAASISALLYLTVRPSSFTGNLTEGAEKEPLVSLSEKKSYLNFLVDLVPSHFLEPFLNHQVISVLILSLGFGIAIRLIPDEEPKNAILSFLKGLNAVLLVFTKWVIKILPIGLVGFTAQAIIQIRNGANFRGLAGYLAIIVFSNLIQGLIILPIWLKLNRVSPWDSFKGMLPALSVAFVSKSSAGTMPITINMAEKNLGIRPQVSRFVLPLCTTINMNGCAAFIFGTVVFALQNHGSPISLATIGIWIVISTIAAIGNAGVPLGCFFLSASLLTSMGVPIAILTIILPFYALIDMVETALNVWSDSCVAAVVEQKLREEEVGDVSIHATEHSGFTI